MRPLLDRDVAFPQSFGLLKLIATALSSISGIPGGIFSPSLAIGAGIGFNLSVLFPSTPVAALVQILHREREMKDGRRFRFGCHAASILFVAQVGTVRGYDLQK